MELDSDGSGKKVTLTLEDCLRVQFLHPEFFRLRTSSDWQVARRTFADGRNRFKYKPYARDGPISGAEIHFPISPHTQGLK